MQTFKSIVGSPLTVGEGVVKWQGERTVRVAFNESSTRVFSRETARQLGEALIAEADREPVIEFKPGDFILETGLSQSGIYLVREDDLVFIMNKNGANGACAPFVSRQYKRDQATSEFFQKVELAQ
jgi:hypothetical protein